MCYANSHECIDPLAPNSELRFPVRKSACDVNFTSNDILLRKGDIYRENIYWKVRVKNEVSNIF